jgi:hypothetical protein
MIRKQEMILAAGFLLWAVGYCGLQAQNAEASAPGEILSFGVNGKRNMLYDARQRPQSVLLHGRVYIVYNADATATKNNKGNAYPILTGESDGAGHRSFVRSEYFDALDPHFTGGTGTYATMHRTRRHKLCVYHGKGVGELFDLEADPWEHDNLWDDPAHATLKNQLLAESYDAHVLLSTDMGSRRIAPM